MPPQGAWGGKFDVFSPLQWGIYNLRKAKEIRKLRVVLTFFPFTHFFFFQVSRETELCCVTLGCMLWSAIKLTESAEHPAPPYLFWGRRKNLGSYGADD